MWTSNEPFHGSGSLRGRYRYLSKLKTMVTALFVCPGDTGHCHMILLAAGLICTQNSLRINRIIRIFVQFSAS